MVAMLPNGDGRVEKVQPGAAKDGRRIDVIGAFDQQIYPETTSLYSPPFRAAADGRGVGSVGQSTHMNKNLADALLRHALLFKKAVDVFEDEGQAREWLMTPQYGLGGAVPLDLATTTFGYREVEKLLTRIEFGTYA